jgi:ABC-type nitrate/sulfonate/bicarbonate transport system permease component
MRNSAWIAVVAALTLVLWWLLSLLIGRIYLVPAPAAVAHALIQNGGMYGEALLYTFSEAAAGLFIGVVFALVLSVVMFLAPLTEKVIMPYAIGMKSTPVIALSPLVAIWFGPSGWGGWLGRATMSALISFFPVLQYVSDAVRSAPEPARLYATVLGTTRLRDLFKIRIWFAVPAFASSLKVAAPLSVVGALVAEFLGSDHGLGHLLFTFVLQLKTAEVFAAVLTVSSAGWLLYGAAAWLERLTLAHLRMEREVIPAHG